MVISVLGISKYTFDFVNEHFPFLVAFFLALDDGVVCKSVTSAILIFLRTKQCSR